MRTTLDITDILHGLINVPDVRNMINGGIYKDERPLNSDKRDVVIVATTIDNEPFQTGVGYVNLHSPGQMPAHAWFKSVSEVILPIIKAHYKRNDYSLMATNVVGPVRNMDDNGFFTTIRVRIRLYYNE